MTSCTGSASRILGILKKVSRVENWIPNEKSRLSLAHRGLGQVSHEMRWWVGGGRDEKARIERMCISPYVEEPLNSKVIKSFVPEVVTCFSNFEISMFCLYGHSMYISHIAISWLWYTLIYIYIYIYI